MKELIDDIYEGFGYLEPDLSRLKAKILEMAKTNPSYNLIDAKNAIKAINRLTYAVDELRSEMFIFEVKHKHIDVNC